MTPDNLNTLTSVQFKLDIKRLPNVSYFMQTAMLPGIDIDAPLQDQPRKNNQVTGSKITFEPLIVTFLVDEDMKNYYEIYRWIMEMMRTDDERSNKTDASLHIMSGQMNTKHVARFVDLFPTSLTELSFGVNDMDSVTTVSTVTFNYAYYDFPEASFTMGNDNLEHNNVGFNTQIFDLKP